MPPKRAAAERTAESEPKKAVAAAAAKPRGRPAGKSAAKKDDAAKKTKTTQAKKPLQEAKANTSAKRKAAEIDEEKPATKKQKRVVTKAAKPPKAPKVPKVPKEPKAKAAPAPKPKKPKVVINTAPTTQLDVFAFGSNSNAELGMGDTFKKADCPRPKFNTVLSNAGVVQISAGGMHGIALTHDNKVLTWGVNDQGALGRDTNWDGGLVDMDKAQEDSDSDDDEEIEVNPKEATPTEIDLSGVEPGTIFTQVVAADSASFALTDDGLVYGWGTFRNSNGVWGFSPDVEIQRTPTLIPGLKSVIKVAAGSNHVLALLSDGSVHSWGSGEQDQLARRIVERRAKEQALVPQKVGTRRGFVDIATGADHSFAVHKDGSIFGWGLNNYGQTGIPSKAGESEAGILKPAVIPSLKSHKITQLAAGNFNSLAITESNECLVWGRIDNHATGIEPTTLALSKDDVIFDERDRPRILTNATPIPGLAFSYATYGTEHAIAVTPDGKAYSWGFNSSNQTGQPGDDDIKVATVLQSKAIADKSFIWAGAGGQYGMIASEHAST
ncbi:putative pheromone response protein [Talaromyces proteolyticus]|uniref:Pheromone response protein n=1 Tax=Talaromyces proteolyticus TaxID=1131652 RepID=A0AAD4PW74_9EURO|nr:putative pheromone response protein [Talaromyces proteolyticus]KAH8692173.1 putative pheromone response protein [Talaromyces proteolyticus]